MTLIPGTINVNIAQVAQSISILCIPWPPKGKPSNANHWLALKIVSGGENGSELRTVHHSTFSYFTSA